MLVSVLLTGALAALATAQNQPAPNACVTGQAVHIIVARASTEKPGAGIIGTVANNVIQQVPGSDFVAVDYPATLDNYQSSERQGVVAMNKLVMDYAQSCPNSQMMLMGYSQGAQVTMDVLCGTAENTFNVSDALSAQVASKVVGVLMMGDPSKAANETFLQGTSTKDGVFPRINTAACASMKGRMISFCNFNDTFCDSGSSIKVHTSYVENNGTAATDFLVKMAKSGGGATGSPPAAATEMNM